MAGVVDMSLDLFFKCFKLFLAPLSGLGFQV
jgi:hypothetical protein